MYVYGYGYTRAGRYGSPFRRVAFCSCAFVYTCGRYTCEVWCIVYRVYSTSLRGKKEIEDRRKSDAEPA